MLQEQAGRRSKESSTQVKANGAKGAGPVHGGQLSSMPDWSVISMYACLRLFIHPLIHSQTLPSAAANERMETCPAPGGCTLESVSLSRGLEALPINSHKGSRRGGDTWPCCNLNLEL